MIANTKKPYAIFGAILVLIGAAVIVAKVIDADVSTALRVVGFSLIVVGVLMVIIILVRRTTRRRHG